MIKIEEYIKLPLSERQSHLKLDEPCIERGNIHRTTSSLYMRGVLAHVLNTTMPVGRNTVLACHACNNWKCSNFNHVYWGTSSENMMDARNCGSKKTGWEYMVIKHGFDKAKEMVRRAASKGGKKYAENMKENLTLDEIRKELVPRFKKVIGG